MQQLSLRWELTELILLVEEVNPEDQNEFKFYPNPANEFITIQNISEKSNLVIFDVIGKKLIQMRQ